ncbi:MAG: hypothetical protein PHG91_09835 [Syntrophales bacterium]|nr:hypothetical protein [Syntrophales bacterium]MDD5233683.1 hypothetical protein [Syntrophales bacterium]MDD5532861.1 hypothetical protein [Syntrophales bacterium]HPL63895.1 hypothetical protein [Syntrophales bacterium]
MTEENGAAQAEATKAQYDDRIRKRIERKVSLAEERDSRVTFAYTLDTRILLDLQYPLDRSLRIARSRVGVDPRYSPEIVFGLIEELYGAFMKLDEINRRLCDLTGRPYRTPRFLEKFRKQE